jgi:4-amino-4-deoxy-L-arabinose transferase-like glycosyltransferase
MFFWHEPLKVTARRTAVPTAADRAWSRLVSTPTPARGQRYRARLAYWLDLERRPRFTRQVIIGVLLLAIAVRVAAALYQGDAVDSLPGIHDQISYDMLARQVLDGKGFTVAENWWPATPAGEPTAHWSYLYTLYLAAVYALAGPHALLARLIQAVAAGILQPWLAWRIGGRLFGKTAGLLSALLTALYAYFIYYASALMTETFFTICLLWSVDLALGLADCGCREGHEAEGGRTVAFWQPRRWLVFGLALGCATLLRQSFALLLPVFFLWVMVAAMRSNVSGGLQWRPKAALAAVPGLFCTALVIVALIAPWTARNYQAFGRFVPLNTNAGFAFFWANHPIQGTDFVALLPASVYNELIPSDLKHLDEAALDQALLWRGWQFVVDDPGRYLRLSLNRTKDYFALVPSAESGLVSSVARVGSFGILAPVMVAGLCLATARRRECVLDQQGLAVVLLCGLAVVYTATYLLSWALPRYRLPVDAMLLLFAAMAIQQLLRRLTGTLLSVWDVGYPEPTSPVTDGREGQQPQLMKDWAGIRVIGEQEGGARWS